MQIISVWLVGREPNTQDTRQDCLTCVFRRNGSLTSAQSCSRNTATRVLTHLVEDTRALGSQRCGIGTVLVGVVPQPSLQDMESRVGRKLPEPGIAKLGARDAGSGVT